MSIKFNEDKTVTVQEYDLANFLLSVAKVAKAGYSPVLDGDKCARGFVNNFYVVLVHDDALEDYQREAVGLEVESPKEVPQEAVSVDSSAVKEQGGNNVPETTEAPKTAPKRPTTKK